MKRFQKVCFLIGVLTLSACAHPSHTMVQPGTGLAVDCSAYGWGWLGAPMAVGIANSCVEKYESIGYIKKEQYLAQGGDPGKIQFYTIPQLVFMSEKQGADIYYRPLDQPGFAKIKDTAPVTLIAPAGALHWQPECYKAVYDGVESNIVCREQAEVMRTVSFTWN